MSPFRRTEISLLHRKKKKKNTVHPCTGIYFRRPRIYMPSFNFFQHAGSAPSLAVCSPPSRASSRVKGRRKPCVVALQVCSLFALGTNLLSDTHTQCKRGMAEEEKKGQERQRNLFFFIFFFSFFFFLPLFCFF